MNVDGIDANSGVMTGASWPSAPNGGSQPQTPVAPQIQSRSFDDGQRKYSSMPSQETQPQAGNGVEEGEEVAASSENQVGQKVGQALRQALQDKDKTAALKILKEYRQYLTQQLSNHAPKAGEQSVQGGKSAQGGQSPQGGKSAQAGQSPQGGRGGDVQGLLAALESADPSEALEATDKLIALLEGAGEAGEGQTDNPPSSTGGA